MSGGKMHKREVQDAYGWWIVGAQIGERFVRTDLPPETSPQARELAVQMCADQLADELAAEAETA